jgi:hypothetical protein
MPIPRAFECYYFKIIINGDTDPLKALQISTIICSLAIPGFVYNENKLPEYLRLPVLSERFSH